MGSILSLSQHAGGRNIGRGRRRQAMGCFRNHIAITQTTPICNPASSGKKHYGIPWGVGGGDAQQVSDCNGRWLFDGSKSYDREFTCHCEAIDSALRELERSSPSCFVRL